MTRSALAIAIAAVLAGSAAFAQQSTTNPQTPTNREDNRGSTYNDSNANDSRSTNSNRGDTNRTSTDRNSTGAMGDNRSANSNANATNRQDEKFLKNFAQANAAEVETGKIALEHAQNSEVKKFAQHMIDDHSKTIGKVEAIASKTNVNVKAEPDLMHKAKASLLDNKDGAKFDQAYVKAMVDDHEKVVEMLQEQIREGQDAGVKQLASQALPDVQKHLKMAQDLYANVSTGNSSRSARNDSNTSNSSGSGSSSHNSSSNSGPNTSKSNTTTSNTSNDATRSTDR
jgi:putative membrane protein